MSKFFSKKSSKVMKIGLIWHKESFHDKRSHNKICRKFHEKVSIVFLISAIKSHIWSPFPILNTFIQNHNFTTNKIWDNSRITSRSFNMMYDSAPEFCTVQFCTELNCTACQKSPKVVKCHRTVGQKKIYFTIFTKMH